MHLGTLFVVYYHSIRIPMYSGTKYAVIKLKKRNKNLSIVPLLEKPTLKD